jgi:hypothetical protein
MTRDPSAALNASDIHEYVRDAMEHVMEINQESYYEGLPDSADMALLGCTMIKRSPVEFVIRTNDGAQFLVFTRRIEDAKHHFHPTVSDPENGPSPDEVPDKCFCDEPDADTTVWPDKCPACIRLRKEAKLGGRAPADQLDTIRCSHHWEVGGGPEA